MAPSAQTAGGRRTARWTRETIVEKILEWEARYGESPSSADWNPSLARWRGQEWRAERYREGHWPSTNAAKRAFDGSFDKAVRAAGLTPHKPGPRRADRPPLPLSAGPVAPSAPTAPSAATVAAPAPAPAPSDEARFTALERRLRAAERRAQRAEEVADEARRRARRALEREARARRARERAEDSERATGALAEDRAEALVADADARVRAAVDQAQAAAHDAGAERAARARAELRIAELGTRLAAVERLASAGGEPADARQAAEERALAAEARERELTQLLCGAARRLTAGELARLRSDGPSGPAALAVALRSLARARGEGGVHALDEALGSVASAAVRWRDAL